MYITVTGGSLRLELSGEDMERHGISLAELDRDSDRSKAFLSRVYSSSRAASGFHVSGDSLVIEIFPAPDGGCTVYFTPEGAIRQEETAKVRLRKVKKTNTVFVFDRLSPLLDAITVLGINRDGENYEGMLFENSGKYFLVLPGDGEHRRIASEYGGRELALREETLREHARQLSENIFRDISRFSDKNNPGKQGNNTV